MAGKNWTDERTAQLVGMVADGVVSQDALKDMAVELDVTARSVGAKLRKMGYEVELASAAARSKWTDAEEAALRDLLQDHNGTLTYAEVAATLEDGKYSAKAVQGKVLSMEMTDYVKPTPKAEVERSYTAEQEATFIEMAAAGEYIEAIAEALGKTINSVRGKALSLSRQVEGFVSPTQETSHAKTKVDAIASLGDKIKTMTVDEIAEAVGKSARGIKTTLTRRALTCADYDGSKKAAKNAADKTA
jgi:transposase